MADITITDPNGDLLASLNSQESTTVGDLFDALGAGVLTKDGILKANKKHILTPGKYTLGPPIQQYDDRLDTVYDYILQERSINETMVISQINGKSYRSLVSSLSLRIKGGVWPSRPSQNDSASVFSWNLNLREDHPTNRAAYMEYLSGLLSWPEGNVLVDCNEEGKGYQSLLSIDKFDGKHSVRGNIDVVVVEKDDAYSNAIKNNIKAGIELKKSNNSGDHEQQVILQHLSSSSLNPEFGLLTLMTDLNERWHFYWFGSSGKRQLYKLATTAQEALFLLEHMFDAPDADAPVPLDFLNRGTWNKFAGLIDEVGENLVVQDDDDVHDCDSNLPGHSESSNDDGPQTDEGDGKHKRGSMVSNNDHVKKHYGAEEELMLDQLQFASENERRAIILGYLADNIVPRMVSSA